MVNIGGQVCGKDQKEQTIKTVGVAVFENGMASAVVPEPASDG